MAKKRKTHRKSHRKTRSRRSGRCHSKRTGRFIKC
jgi:hypothetical protein